MRNHVRELREVAGMSREELGNKVSCTRQTIFTIENGKHIPSVLIGLNIAAVFALPVERIFHRDDSTEPCPLCKAG